MKKKGFYLNANSIKQSNASSQRTKQLMVPETSQTESVYNLKSNQYKVKINSQHNQSNVQCTKLKAYELSILQNKQVSSW